MLYHVLPRNVTFSQLLYVRSVNLSLRLVTLTLRRVMLLYVALVYVTLCYVTSHTILLVVG